MSDSGSHGGASLPEVTTPIVALGPILKEQEEEGGKRAKVGQEGNHVYIVPEERRFRTLASGLLNGYTYHFYRTVQIGRRYSLDSGQYKK